MSWGEQKRLSLLMSSVSSAFSYSDSETTAETELHGQPAMEIDWSKLIKMLRNAKVVSKSCLVLLMFIVTKPARFVFTASVPVALKVLCIRVLTVVSSLSVSCLNLVTRLKSIMYIP